MAIQKISFQSRLSKNATKSVNGIGDPINQSKPKKKHKKAKRVLGLVFIAAIAYFVHSWNKLNKLEQGMGQLNIKL